MLTMTTRCARMASVSVSDSSEYAITGDTAHAQRRTSVSATEEANATRREGEVGEGNERREPSSAAARRGAEREANTRSDRRGALARPSAAGSDEADAALIDPSMPARVVQCVERPHPAEALTTTSPRKMLTKQTQPKQSLVTTEFARRRREVALLGAPRSIRRSEAAILSEHETATCQRRRPVNPKP